MPSADRPPLLDDPALPGGSLVLDRAELQAWLTESLGRSCSVTPRRLRYKAGTSAVLGFDLGTLCDGVVTTQSCVASSYSEHAAPKAEKTSRSGPPGSCLAYDTVRHTVVTTAAGDRALPLLPTLGQPDGVARVVRRLIAGPDMEAARIRTVRHNPGRRWVGILEGERATALLLRAYGDSRRMARAAACYRALAHGGARTPGVVAHSRGLATLAVTWVAGDELDLSASTELWEAAGGELARLHKGPSGPLSETDPASAAEAVLRAGRQIAALLPEISPDVLDITRTTAAALERAPGDRVAVHGDFSADQVVVGPDEMPVLIDLDSARRGPSAYDVGCLTASTMTSAEMEGAASRGEQVMAAFLTGYDHVRPLPDEAAVAVHTAAFRLRKAIDPFRACAPDWREQVTARVAATRVALEDIPLARTRP